jgi:hypothetical protein
MDPSTSASIAKALVRKGGVSTLVETKLFERMGELVETPPFRCSPKLVRNAG